MMAVKTQNERLAIVENDIKHIGSTVIEIKTMLEKHIEASQDVLTKKIADQLYANKGTELYTKSLRRSSKIIGSTALVMLIGVLGFLLQEGYYLIKSLFVK